MALLWALADLLHFPHAMKRRDFRPDTGKRQRVNGEIRKSPVRLIDDEGAQLGVVPVAEALEIAEEKGLDLVEVGPEADPPVGKSMDWGKVRFERAPYLGEHTDQVLGADLALDAEVIQKLRDAKVLG